MAPILNRVNKFIQDKIYCVSSNVYTSFIENGPVKVSIWTGTTNNQYYSGFATYVKGLGSPQQYKYFNDFSWYTSWDIDWFAIRMQAIFRAPETGTFTFIVTADDYAVFDIYDCLTCIDYTRVAYAKGSSCFNCFIR